MRRRAYALWGVLVAFAGPEAGQPDEPADDCRPLFSIHRNTNRNELVYEACLAGGEFASQPIRAHWVMRESDGHREELTALEERFAYGTVIRAASPDAVSFGLRALPAGELVARREGDEVRAFTEIDGRSRALVSVYIELGGGLFPSVRSVELVGRDTAGAICKEQLVP